MNTITQSPRFNSLPRTQKAPALQETWEVAGKTYDSTQSLLENADSFEMNDAYYNCKELRSKTLGEKVGGFLRNGLVGGAIATGLNAALAIATGGASIGVSGAVLLGGVALGALSGTMGSPEASAEGKIDTKNGTTMFYPDNIASAGVEIRSNDQGLLLAEYA